MSEITFTSSVLVAGKAAQAQALVLSAPISFWGGVDPKTGRIADVRHLLFILGIKPCFDITKPQHSQAKCTHSQKVPGIVTFSWNYFQAATFSYHNAALYNILQRLSGLTVSVKKQE